MNAQTPPSSAATPSSSRWHRALGVRPGEAQTVGLFFAHNFLLGIGTILIYVAANAILLENNPETSLPLAYILSAIGMVAAGRVYAHFEHHWLLSKLAGRVLLSVVVLTVVVGVLVAVGHSVAAAVAIMVGYRIIYLLANLEFWGVSAVVFDTRQSKRLFSVISSGDMPAKAIGAVLAALVHAHEEMLRLLILALVAFVASLFVLRKTIASHEVHALHRPVRAGRQPTSALVQKRFGGSELILFMCLSLATLAAVATQIEYSFFINVKHRFHEQTDVILYVSLILAATYGIAMVVKLLLSRQALDRLGIERSLLILPWVAMAGLVGLVVLNLMTTDETARLVFFCGLYLVFEVVRRSLFDPVFLVLFQPLSAPQRLQGHTIAKGLYEPLGLGIAGFMIFILHAHPTLEMLMPLVWIMLLGGLAWLLGRTYTKYLHELNDAIGKRFLERDDLAMPAAAQIAVLERLTSKQSHNVMAAIGWLDRHDPDELARQIPALLTHADPQVRRQTLTVAARQTYPLPLQPIRHVALTDSEPNLREQAAYLLGRRISANPADLAPLLNHTDLTIRQGAIRGVLELNPHDPAAVQSLTSLTTSMISAQQHTALRLIGLLRLTDFAPTVARILNSNPNGLLPDALFAAGQLTDPTLTKQLVAQLADPKTGRMATHALRGSRANLLPLLRDAWHANSSPILVERVASICGSIQTPDSRRLLNELAQQPDLRIRGAALRALRRFPNDPTDDAIFRELLDDETALAQRLIYGDLHEPNDAIAKAIAYEMTGQVQRLFDILAQLYDEQTIAGARLGVHHPARERRANALELLDNLIPRAVYQTLLALVDLVSARERVQLVDAELGTPPADYEQIRPYILEKGETVFSAWTVALVLRTLPAADADVIRQTYLTRLYPSALLMAHTATANHQIPDYERVLLLTNASLFAETPENVLASIAPIMKEENYRAGDVIFQKGDLGTALYVIDAGEVSILDGETQLAQFGRGDFFGELALLDAETRSATAEALTDLRLLRLDQDDFFDLMEERSEVLRSIVRNLSGRIRRQNKLLTNRPAEQPAN